MSSVEDYNYGPAGESPSDAVVEHAAATNRITNYDDVIGLCSECKSEIPEQKMERDVFVQNGFPSPCPYCGGVVVITFRELANEALKDRLDANRGIGRG